MLASGKAVRGLPNAGSCSPARTLRSRCGRGWLPFSSLIPLRKGPVASKKGVFRRFFRPPWGWVPPRAKKRLLGLLRGSEAHLWIEASVNYPRPFRDFRPNLPPERKEYIGLVPLCEVEKSTYPASGAARGALEGCKPSGVRGSARGRTPDRWEGAKRPCLSSYNRAGAFFWPGVVPR